MTWCEQNERPKFRNSVQQRRLNLFKPDVMLGASGAQCPTAQVVRLQANVVSAQPRHSKRLTKRRASSERQAASSSDNERKSWDQITNRMVSCSSIPFSILVLPQVVQNISYMAAGNMSALSVISWEGWLSGLLGNTLLCSHFANSGENSAMMVQVIGIANGMAVLTQLALAACMPRTVFAVAVACVLLAVSMSVARLTGRIPAPAKGTGQLGVWKTWQLVSGAAGLSLVPQVLYNTMNPGTSNWLPGAMTLLALALWYAVPANRVDREGRPSVEQLPGLASTLLFALSPLPQLARNFLDPGSLEGLSIGTMLLAVTGNALMVPRALFVRDPLWRLGTCWACIATWTQLLSMFIRESSVTGLRYVSPPLFAAVTAVMACYFAFVFTRNAKIQALAK